MGPDIETRLEKLESLVEHQREQLEKQATTVERQRERIEHLEEALEGSGSTAPNRRTVLRVGGVLAALGIGAGTATATPTGQIGSASRPLASLYTESLAGGVTGGQTVTDIVGDGFAVQNGQVGVDAGKGLAVRNGTLTVVPGPEPKNLDAILDGMEQDNGTYLVRSVYELQAINADLDASYRLAADIDASPTTNWNGGKGFDPLGGLGGSNSENPFTGAFDGNGHVIEDLTISRPDTNRIGLFRQLGTNIGNVVLTNVDITGNQGVGAVVGADGGIDGGVNDCYATGTVDGAGAVGGIVGFTTHDVTRCGAAVDVSGQNRIGGLVGETGDSYSIADSYATGTVTGDQGVGGLVGGWAQVLFDSLPTEGTISTSFATGAVSGSTEVGGVIGARAPDDSNSAATSLSDTFWDTDGTNQTEGIGNASDTGTTGLNTADMQGDTLDSSFDGALDFSGTWATVTGPDDYPVLQAIDETVQLESR